MATAIQVTPQARGPQTTTELLIASVLGAAAVLGGLALAGYYVPEIWRTAISPQTAAVGGAMDAVLRVMLQIGVFGLVVLLAGRLAGANPPVGLRGGIALVVSLAITIFFVTRAVGLNLERSALAPYGLPITVAVLAGLLALAYRFLSSDTGVGVMKAVEAQGWVSTTNYKRTQGLKLRRYTLIGILILGLTGVYSMVSARLVEGDWILRLPFTDGKFLRPLTDLEYSAPILLALATFWLAWRAVNVPNFADFLIATEAEMNKVTWSSRKRLYQDTIVVLVTVLIMTTFLLAVDFVAAGLMNQVGVLPSKDKGETAGQTNSAQGTIRDW